MVPVQRILKYHLLLQELVRHTQSVSVEYYQSKKEGLGTSCINSVRAMLVIRVKVHFKIVCFEGIRARLENELRETTIEKDQLDR